MQKFLSLSNSNNSQVVWIIPLHGIWVILQNWISREYHYLEISISIAKTKTKIHYILRNEQAFITEISKRKFHVSTCHATSILVTDHFKTLVKYLLSEVLWIIVYISGQQAQLNFSYPSHFVNKVLLEHISHAHSFTCHLMATLTLWKQIWALSLQNLKCLLSGSLQHS